MFTELIEDFFQAYVEAALWSSTDDYGEPLDRNYDWFDIAPETLNRMKKDCRTFFLKNVHDILCKGGPTDSNGSNQAAMAGHDFWLNRCRHGAGFWDGDWPEPHGSRLTRSAEAYSNSNLYLGDDGLIYQA